MSAAPLFSETLIVVPITSMTVSLAIIPVSFATSTSLALCPSLYIGQIGCCLAERFVEHRLREVRLKKDTAVSHNFRSTVYILTPLLTSNLRHNVTSPHSNTTTLLHILLHKHILPHQPTSFHTVEDWPFRSIHIIIHILINTHTHTH